MKNVLFINACTTPSSRTLRLSRDVLKKIGGTVEAVELYKTPLSPLDFEGMKKRSEAASKQDFSDPDFRLAKQFAAADVIVIAAPYWDLMFPSVLKVYLENIAVSCITFDYTEEGRPKGLCRAKELHYVTTAGGFIGENDFGFSYVKALAQNFFDIPDVFRYAAEGLDLRGADVEGILEKAMKNVSKNRNEKNK